MSAELAVVRTALTCYSGKKECPGKKESPDLLSTVRRV